MARSPPAMGAARASLLTGIASFCVAAAAVPPWTHEQTQVNLVPVEAGGRGSVQPQAGPGYPPSLTLSIPLHDGRVELRVELQRADSTFGPSFTRTVLGARGSAPRHERPQRHELCHYRGSFTVAKGAAALAAASQGPLAGASVEGSAGRDPAAPLGSVTASLCNGRTELLLRGRGGREAVVESTERAAKSEALGLASDHFARPMVAFDASDANVHGDSAAEHASAGCGVDTGHGEEHRSHGVRGLDRALASSQCPESGDAYLSPTKHVEVLVVSDGPLHAEKGDDVFDFGASIATSVAQLYADASFPKYTIKVDLVAQYAFTEDSDPFNPGACSGGDCKEGEIDTEELLNQFLDWRTQALADGLVPQHDVGVLLSARDFAGSTIGLAPLNSLCDSSSSGNVDQATASSTTSHAAALVAHELGHNFGLIHTKDTDCSGDDTQYIMDATTGTEAASKFSSCAEEDLAAFLEGCPYRCTPGESSCDGGYYDRGDNSACLENEPDELWTAAEPTCGNGFREQGEDCDCGKADCSGTSDPCCDGRTCRLAASASCSARDACCDKASCGVVSADANKNCRASGGVCDPAEYCDGVSSRCPGDDMLPPGTGCPTDAGSAGDPSLYDGTCYLGRCWSANRQCLSISTSSLPIDGACPRVDVGDVCGSLTCAHDGSCFSLQSQDGTLLQTRDGTRCGDSRQCLGKDCRDSWTLFGSWAPKQLHWWVSSWRPSEGCADPTCTQWRVVQCRNTTTGAVLDDDACAKQDLSTPDAARLWPFAWQPGDWGACDEDCGNGTRTRTVACVERGGGEAADDADCEPLRKPPTQEFCRTQPCASAQDATDAAFDVGPWLPCDVLCRAAGTDPAQMRVVTCRNTTTYAALSDAACEAEGHDTPARSQPCSVPPCPTFDTGAWGSCSVSCGRGVRVRAVACVDASGAASSACLGAAPLAREPCWEGKCYHYTTGAWSECEAQSATGEVRDGKPVYSGTKTRDVGGACVEADSGKQVADGVGTCTGPLPPTRGSCETTDPPPGAGATVTPSAALLLAAVTAAVAGVGDWRAAN